MGFLETVFKRKFIERDHRFSIEEHHDISIAVDGNLYPVNDISFSGVSFYAEDLSEKLSISDESIVSFRFNDHIFNVSGQVTRVSKNLVAFKVTTNNSRYKSELINFFSINSNNVELKRRDVNELNYDGAGEIDWLYGDELHEVFFVTEKNKVNAFWINFQNVIFEFDTNLAFKTFLYSEQSWDISIELEGQSHFLHDPSILFEMNQLVLEFIQNLELMEDSTKVQIIKIIEEQLQA